MGVKEVAPYCQLLLVVGSMNSSNSKRLVEVCENSGVRAFLVDDENDVNPAWLVDVTTVAVTAGASAPENLVQNLVSWLRHNGFSSLEEVELVEEDVHFSLPGELQAGAPRLTNISLS
jgi:4-hydroxy-3-methylbut-2-enyl diphosphate reductase